MKRNKLGLSVLLLGSLGFMTCLLNGETSSVPAELLNQNVEFLVVLPGTSRSKSDAEIKASQDNFLANLNHLIGKDNYTVTGTLDEINVLKIKANESYQPLIESINGVQKVAVNQVYRFSETSSIAGSEAAQKEGYITLNNASSDATSTENASNMSAETMNVPEDSAGGAGSFVAILDSGFYLEHNYYDVFDDQEVIEMAQARFNYDDLKAVYDDLEATHKIELDSTLANDPTYEGGKTSTNNATQNRADGSLYWSLKIPFYYDYGASSENSANDYDVLSTWSEHGNHVATITGANGYTVFEEKDEEGNVTSRKITNYDGIAPNAQLALMKVFYESIPTDDTSAGGVYATDDDILEALNDCLVLGVDGLNMSLGSDLDDFSDKSGAIEVIDKLSIDGVNCNIAAGNAGKDMFSSMSVYKDWSTDSVDTGILGSYSNSTYANIIASNTNPTQYYEHGIRIDNTDGTYSVFAYDDQVDYTEGNEYGITEENQKLLERAADKNGKIQLVTAGMQDSSGNFYGTSADYQKVTAAFGNDYFRGKIAVVDRGSNSFVDKAQAAEDVGCAGLIVINNDPTAYEFNFGMSWSTGDANGSYSVPDIPVAFVLYGDRDTILDSLTPQINEADDAPVCFASSGDNTSIISEREDVNPKANQLSDFSSDGATSSLDLAPTISAPGTSIRGAILGEANSQGQVPEDSLDPNAVGYLNGTSMATPNYTGITALMIGEKQKEHFDAHGTLLSDEERLAYLKTITMRTMSTADQYEFTNTVYEEFTSEDTVTDDDYETPVTIYKATSSQNTAPYSPRKQGAGVVNAAHAINTPVYLEGLVPDSKTGEYGSEHVGNNFAKVELRNNDKIANGTISLGIRLHNEAKINKTYKATLKVMAPLVNKYHNHDNELPNYVAKDTTFEGAELQTSYDTILETIDLGEVSVTSNETVKDVIFPEKTITDASKEYLSKFKNGTYLEGYLCLEDSNSDETQDIDLSLPFMGFYGDYGQAEATEPFEFEKEKRYDMTTGDTDGHVYGSDLVNYLGANSYSRSYINMSSMIVGASFEDYQVNNRKAGVLVNSTNPLDFGKALTYTKDAEGNTTLYVGSDETDVLYIQEFVNRSMNSEIVEILDETGDVVISGNVKDIITNTTNLYKSHVSSSYIGDYSLAHRGYTELPLYYENGARLQDGNYKIRFTYNLVYGSTQVKQFNLVVDSKAPSIVSKSIIVDSSGNKTLRLKFNEIYIPSSQYVHINADMVKDFTLTKASDGYYLDIKIPQTLDGDKLYINISDGTYNFSYYMVNTTDIDNGVMIESDALTPGSTYSYTITNEGNKNNISDRYVVSAKDYTGNNLDLGEYTVILTYPKKVNSTAKVFGITSSGSKVDINYTRLDDTTIKFKTTYTTFTVEDNGKGNDYVSDSANATVSYTENVEHGKVYVDKVSGFSGEISTIYAIPDAGYRVGSVKVNGVEIARDLNGNYQFILNGGVNVVEVTFVAL